MSEAHRTSNFSDLSLHGRVAYWGISGVCIAMLILYTHFNPGTGLRMDTGFNLGRVNPHTIGGLISGSNCLIRHCLYECELSAN